MSAQKRREAETILNALHWRYATKQFDQSRKVSDEDLNTIFDAIRLAPTSAGLQPFQIIAVTDPARKSAMFSAARKQGQVLTASHVLVFCARPNTSDRVDRLLSHLARIGTAAEKIKLLRKRSRLGNLIMTLMFSKKSWTARQAYIALGFALLTAAQLGIDSCPMEGFQPGKLAKSLDLPRGLYPVALLALGYRSADDMVRPKYRLPREELISTL